MDNFFKPIFNNSKMILRWFDPASYYVPCYFRHLALHSIRIITIYCNFIFRDLSNYSVFFHLHSIGLISISFLIFFFLTFCFIIFPQSQVCFTSLLVTDVFKNIDYSFSITVKPRVSKKERGRLRGEI